MNKFRNFKLISLFCILAFALVFIGFHFLQAQGNSKKDKPPGKPKPPPPELSLDYGDIVTAESDALSVWRYSDSSSDSIWTTETQSYYYSDVAVGNVDSDPELEIVVPVVKEMKSPGPNAGPFKISIDVYKEGSEIPLSSESFIDASRVICDITIANVIPENGETIDEIVLLHWYNLVVFQWDESNSNFCIVEQIEARKKDLLLLCFNGMTTKNVDADVDTDDIEEIFVSGGDAYYGAGEDYIGYIYMIDMDNSAGCNPCSIGPHGGFIIDGNIIGLGHSLRVADLDGDNDFEICLPGLVENRLDDVSHWTAYLLVLDLDQEGWISTIIPEYEIEKNVFPYIRLDVGELDITYDGEEIALCVNQQQRSDYHLYIFKYPFTNNVTPLICEYALLDADSVYDIKIGNICSTNEVYSGNEIVVCGTAPPLKGKSLIKYFEVFTYPDLSPCWPVFGEKGSIGDLAIVEED